MKEQFRGQSLSVLASAKLSAALRANAQKKNCYAAGAAATFLRIIFYSPLRFIKNSYAIAPMKVLTGSLRSLGNQPPTGCRNATKKIRNQSKKMYICNLKQKQK